MKRRLQTILCGIGAAWLLLSPFFALRIKFSDDPSRLFLPQDPVVTAGPKALEVLFLLVEWEGREPPDSIRERVGALVQSIRAMEGVRAVHSPFEVPALRWVTPTEWRWEEREGSFDTLRKDPSVAKTFLRRDGRGLLLKIDLEPGKEPGALHEIEGLLDQIEKPLAVTVAGRLPFQQAGTRVACWDAMLITGLLVPVLLALLALLFRSWLGALAAVLTAVLSALSTLGTACLLGFSLSRFALIAMPIVIMVALLDNLHILSLSARSDNRGISEILAPCLWTSLTEVAGFLTMELSSLPQVRLFGRLAALGTGLAFFASFLILWPLVSRLRLRPLPWSRGLWRRLLKVSPWPVVGVAMLLLVVSFPGLSRLRVQLDFPRLWAADHPLTRQVERIERDWGGLAGISFLLTPREGVRLNDPSVMSRLTDFTRLLGQRRLVTAVVSPLDGIQNAAQGFRETFGRPPSPEEVRYLIRRLETTEEPRTFSITARLAMMRPDLFPAVARDLEGFRKNLGDLFEVTLAGWPLVYKKFEDKILREVLAGFLAAFGAVALQLLIAVRWLRGWFLALLPNLLPLVLVGGVMGYLGVGFDSGLLLAPGMAMGLIVDDTIHFVHQIRREALDGHPVPVAVGNTLEKTGVALILTSIVLLIGFSLLFFSSFVANRHLAGVMVSIVILALVGEVVLFPALLRIFGGRSGTAQSTRPTAAATGPSLPISSRNRLKFND